MGKLGPENVKPWFTLFLLDGSNRWEHVLSSDKDYCGDHDDLGLSTSALFRGEFVEATIIKWGKMELCLSIALHPVSSFQFLIYVPQSNTDKKKGSRIEFRKYKYFTIDQLTILKELLGLWLE